MNESDEIVAIVNGMHSQERKWYLTQDYFYEHSHMETSLLGPRNVVAVSGRQAMVGWCYKVIDFCRFDRETVEYAMNYLDRYLYTAQGAMALKDRKLFQLATMTCLYTAVKVNEPEVMTPELMEELSNGDCTAMDVEIMELKLLNELGWRVCTPTTQCYLRCFLQLIPSNIIDSTTKAKAYELSLDQLEWALGDYELVQERNFVVAVAAVSNALHCLEVCFDFGAYLSRIMTTTDEIESDMQIARSIQDILCDGIPIRIKADSDVSEERTNVISKHLQSESATSALSPRSVSAGDGE